MLCLEAQDALNGPSDSTHDFGEVFTLSDGTKLVDDCLTSDERDLICGTNIVYTGAFIIGSIALMLKGYRRIRGTNFGDILVAQAVHLDSEL
jgi:hypothetical protein